MKQKKEADVERIGIPVSEFLGCLYYTQIVAGVQA